MSKITYRLREDCAFDERGACIPVYGIELLCGKEMLSSYPDLFTDRERAEVLVEACRSGEPAIAHLPDIIEDFLSK